MLVLDTHALIWAHAGIRIPKKVEKRILAAGAKNELFVSAITPWEIAHGVRRNRIKIAGDVLEWIHEALDALSASIASLEPAIAVDAVDLPWEHADPSDRIIVATARRLGAYLVTADTAVLDFAEATRAVRVLEL
ncbi:MAG TPA: type II toxin-antitoxin system VapC family toxin [Kofleriaceae bacterium]|jgi:PIN domain nuclease of toxin-antitoxin system|nr:type II toxin-antitoxin system VapC family toxin [Kofleriaceae bacterium]